MAASTDSSGDCKQPVLNPDSQSSSDDERCGDAGHLLGSNDEDSCELRALSKEREGLFEEQSSTEDLRRRYRHSPLGNEIHRVFSPMIRSRPETDDEVVRCSGNASLLRRPSFMNPRTTSRLTDSPADLGRRSECVMMSGASGNAGRNEDDAFWDEDIPEEFKKMELSTLTLAQLVSLILIVVFLVCSLSVPLIKKQTLLDLHLWKWDIMFLVIICGRLCSDWSIRLAVLFIERSFLLRKRVLYFVYGLKRPVQNSVWLGLILITWNSVFDDKVANHIHTQVLPFVTKILLCLWAGTIIWLLKTLIVKVLALSFHVNAFFERIQESLFNQYVIETLSIPPMIDRESLKVDAEREFVELQIPHYSAEESMDPPDLRSGPCMPRSGDLEKSPKVGMSPIFRCDASNAANEEISIDRLHMLNQNNISAWNMKRLMNIIRHGALYTLDERILKSDAVYDPSLEIRTESLARRAANKIFHNVAKVDSQYIYLDDLSWFMREDEALKTMHLLDAATDGRRISKSSLKNWMVNAFRERRALALSLKDTNTAVDELQRFLNFVVGIVFVVACLIIMEVRMKHFFVFFSSQMLLLKFVFGNSCKTLFEAIIFLFVVHPFDVGDRCEVDGMELVVEEMKIMSTTFLRCDNQKIIYPNSTLATKPISNYYRSPDMGDSVDFSIDISTPVDTIAMMKDRIISCVESKKEHWNVGTMIVTMGVEEMNSLSMSVWLTHKMNHQDMGERWSRRALLVEEMVKVLRDLDIDHRLLPLGVNANRSWDSTSLQNFV